MKTWIVFLRGINVGGKNKLPMAELRDCLGAHGFDDIKTYIRSGNVVLRSAATAPRHEIEKRVKSAIKSGFGFDILVMVLTPEYLLRSMEQNPWGQSFESPNFMFLYFLGAQPEAPDLDGLRAVKTDNEKLELIEDVCYAYAGDGAGRSKMFARIERSLGVPATARNWRTLQKMTDILREVYGHT